MVERDIKITKIVHRGLGLGHKNGKTYMVYYSLPEETADAEIIMTKKSYSIAKALNIRNPSPYRTNPSCEYYQACGGCQIMHSSYNFQIEIKKAVLSELLYRSLKKTCEIKCIASLHDTGYRLRAQFIVKNAKVGFTRFSSNEFIKIDKCIICHDKINEAILRLSNNISSVELNRLFIATDGKNTATYPIKDYNNSLNISINGFRFIIKPQIFFQANIFMLSQFQSEVISGENGITAVDFYAGSGFFSLPLSKKFEFVLSVEEVSESSHLLNKNILLNKIQNIETINSSVENADIPLKYSYPDLLILDPPRAGMSKKAIGRALNMKPKKIIYVSCDPATLSRDISYFYKHFYEIDEIILLDQFPHTFHFETIVKMRNRNL
ncbi:MAG: hypothetical protein N3B13_06245 [Deltaproteobacteria bacterium]|nr:hypothetical protein [Deltaproteobacteria bacterium]